MKRSLSRAAFTLMELLVVISIIGILVAIMVPTVFYYIDKGTETKAASELGQLATSVTNFKTKFGCFPPSKIKLCANRADYGTGSLDVESLYWIDKMWPRIGNFTNIAWNGNIPVSLPQVLEGNECLVFFLGGIPSFTAGSPGTYGCLGFATSPTNPASTTNTQDRIGPFYNFEPARLYSFSPSGFPSYLDPRSTPTDLQKKPYAYFSSGKRPNQYDTVLGQTTTGSTAVTLPSSSVVTIGMILVGPPLNPGTSVASITSATQITLSANATFTGTFPLGTGTHCGMIGARPYFSVLPTAGAPAYKYHNSDTFQIIFAGKDRTFGGNLWDPANPSNMMPPSGIDDRSNFCANTLGAGN